MQNRSWSLYCTVARLDERWLPCHDPWARGDGGVLARGLRRWPRPSMCPWNGDHGQLRPERVNLYNICVTSTRQSVSQSQAAEGRSDGRARARAAEPRRRDSGGALTVHVPVEGPDGPGSARGDLRRPQTHTHPPIPRLPGSRQRAPATAGGRVPPQRPARFSQPPATLIPANRGG